MENWREFLSLTRSEDVDVRYLQTLNINGREVKVPGTWGKWFNKTSNYTDQELGLILAIHDYASGVKNPKSPVTGESIINPPTSQVWSLFKDQLDRLSESHSERRKYEEAFVKYSALTCKMPFDIPFAGVADIIANLAGSNVEEEGFSAMCKLLTPYGNKTRRNNPDFNDQSSGFTSERGLDKTPSSKPIKQKYKLHKSD